MLTRHRPLIGYLILVAAVVAGFFQTAAIQHHVGVQGRAQNRASVVTSCKAYNKSASGVALLVEQLRRQTETSKQRTPAEKKASLAFLDVLLADFPKLDCTADPIRLD